MPPKSPPSHPLTAAEIQEHPEYPHVFGDLKPTQKGKASVAEGRGGPFNIAYEVHGHGARKLVVCYLCHSHFPVLGTTPFNCESSAVQTSSST